MDMAKKLFFAQRTLTTLFSTVNKLQMQGDKYLQDITIRQMLAVAAIAHAPAGQATVNYIARQLGTTKQSAKQIVDTLCKKKYLTVTPCIQDKRAVNVSVAPEAEQTFHVCSERTDEFLAAVFHDFTAQELETFCRLLERLYRFDGMEPEGFGGHMKYNPADGEGIKQHHKKFFQGKENANIKEK